MDITGYSTDFIVDKSFLDRLRMFVKRQIDRWPGLFFCGQQTSAEELAVWRAVPVPDGEPSEILTFSSGSDMEDFWEENGYELNDFGEGPFSVFYSSCRHQLFAKEVRGVRCADESDAQAVEGVGLIMAEYFAVSLVTPRDPKEDQFSGSVLREFIEALAGEPPVRG